MPENGFSWRFRVFSHDWHHFTTSEIAFCPLMENLPAEQARQYTHTQTIGCPPSKCDEFHHGNLGNRGISGQFPGQVLVYTIKDTSEWNGQMWPCIVCMNFSQYFFNLVAWPRLTGQARNAITLLKKQLDDATVGSSTSAEHQGFQVAMLLHQGSLDTNRCGFRKSVARIHTCTF